MKDQACIFNIQKFSIHDGPGIRTVVFSKDARYVATGAQILNRKMETPSKCGILKRINTRW